MNFTQFSGKSTSRHSENRHFEDKKTTELLHCTVCNTSDDKLKNYFCKIAIEYAGAIGVFILF